MANRVWAFGTTLKLNGTTVAAVKGGPQGPNETRDTIDATAHDSPDGYREFLGSFSDGGEVSFDIWYDPADGSHGSLQAARHATEAGSWDIVFPTTPSHQITFDGWLTGFNPTAEKDDGLTASVTIKVTGKPEIT
jgi:predicted secreted protein